MKKYDVEYKQEVCKRIVNEGESTAQVARELGISADTIYTWVSRYRQSGADCFPGSGRLRPEDAELKRMQKEIRDLGEEKEILKRRRPTSQKTRSKAVCVHPDRMQSTPGYEDV